METLQQIWQLSSRNLIVSLIGKGKRWSIGDIQENRIVLAKTLLQAGQLVPADAELVKNEDFEEVFRTLKTVEDLEQGREILEPKFVCGKKVIKKIGRGTHGVVYLVDSTDFGLTEPCVLKVPSFYNASKSRKIGIYNLQELDILFRLKHPYLLHACVMPHTTLSFSSSSVVSGTDVRDLTKSFSSSSVVSGTDVGDLTKSFSSSSVVCGATHFGIVLPYVPYNLDQVMLGEFSFAEKISCVYKLVQAVKYLHDQDILHLDLSPSNILVNENLEKIYVADFGMAKTVHAPESMFVSMQEYMPWHFRPPENLTLKQQNSEQTQIYSQATDVWGIGAILFCFLASTRTLCPRDHEWYCEKKIYKFYEYWIESKEYLQLRDKLLTSGVSSKTVVHALDLVEKTLTLRAATRIKLSDFLMHPLFDECRETKSSSKCTTEYTTETKSLPEHTTEYTTEIKSSSEYTTEHTKKIIEYCKFIANARFAELDDEIVYFPHFFVQAPASVIYLALDLLQRTIIIATSCYPLTCLWMAYKYFVENDEVEKFTTLLVGFETVSPSDCIEAELKIVKFLGGKIYRPSSEANSEMKIKDFLRFK